MSHHLNLCLTDMHFIKMNLSRFSMSLDGDGPPTNLEKLWFRSLPANYKRIYVSLRLIHHKNLYWRRANLGGSIPNEMGMLLNLTRLDLAQNNLVHEIPAELGELLCLTDLYLNNNMLTGWIPVELGKLVKLKCMSLHGNLLSGRIPIELGNAIALEFLYLDHNCLLGTLPFQLGQLVALVELTLEENAFEGLVPWEWSNLILLKEISLMGSNTLTLNWPAEVDPESRVWWLIEDAFDADEEF
ncbi:hypothetical protein HDU98_010260 [Podochytrium sp. JEL0797]|nr:hypothetical protein HDU98_010242 [Podochytrium sp. JEL0797]KAJ3076984.1 hypothetical protein HDU98_010260 [Podochytrium sp. JEL0797]